MVAGCGGSDGDRGAGRDGGSITIAQTSQPDALDPALGYTTNSWEALWVVYTPLLTYRHEEGARGSELIPGLARDLPRVSADGLTYVLRLRDGLRYSDGTPVRASDFEHAVKRLLTLESGGSSFFEEIAGVDRYLKAKRPQADISGIEADDGSGRIRITLTHPDGTFSNVLAMTLAAPVPGDTPFRNLTSDPPPGVGAYEITDSVPNRHFVLRRNPRFAGLGIQGVPAGRLASITTDIVKSPARQAQDVIRGDLDYMQDAPPADIKPEVRSRYGDRFKETPAASTYYFFLNTRVAPFDDPRVRRAVNYGIDKRALVRLFAGALVPGCSFVPPSVPGYDMRLDRGHCPWGDPSARPDLDRARRLIAEAGAKGAKVTVWGNSDNPTDKVTLAYADMLKQIGLDARPRIVDGSVYFQVIGNQGTRAQTGFNNWFQDFPHPKDFFFLVDGRSIQATNNPNPGNVADPEIDRDIAALNRRPHLTPAVTARWEALNRTLVERAWVAPYGHSTTPTFLSERMNFHDCAVVHPVYGNDYSRLCLK